jgi:hypothetical protein
MCWQIRSSAKRGGDSSDDSTRLALQLPPGHSDHTVAEGLELCIPNAIALEPRRDPSATGIRRPRR